MESNFNNSLEILRQAQQELLYAALLKQVRKDFTLANVDIKISEDAEPSHLKDVLREKIYVLLLEHHQRYMNLLYVVDIPETEIEKLQALDAVDTASEVCFLILKREWKKVWYKHKYNT